MIDAATRHSPIIELYDVTPDFAAFLAPFFGIAPHHDHFEPLLIPASRRHVTWIEYESFLAEAGDRPLRHSFADGTLELMSPRMFERENAKAVLRRFVQTLSCETRQPIVTLGTTTFASPSRSLGIEPDEAFCVARQVPLQPGLFVDTDHAAAPHLVIEVGRLQQDHCQARMSAVEVDRLELLARLGVHEVWFFDNDNLQILHNHDQQVHAADHSQFLPSVSGPMLSRHLRNRHRIGENDCITEFVAEALTA